MATDSFQLNLQKLNARESQGWPERCESARCIELASPMHGLTLAQLLGQPSSVYARRAPRCSVCGGSRTRRRCGGRAGRGS